MDEPEYAARMEVKRKLCIRHNIGLIVVEAEDILDLGTKLGELIKMLEVP